MNTSMTRRQFVQRSSAIGTGLILPGALASLHGADAPSRKIILGIMGANGRGSDLARGLVSQPGVEIAYVCDVDERAVAKASKIIVEKQARPPQGVKDFRRILEDRAVDALVIAAPDHWHAPATILACAAGKHVYVEKPASHNPHEGELMVKAARKYGRIVQLGTQRRSMPGVMEAVERLRGGVIGKVLFSRGWYNNERPSIGRGHRAAVPDWLDFPLWQGPAPDREYRDNLLHYNWHWFWHWGTGELGNNGIHALDVCRWGLGVDYPTRVSSGGGKYRYEDDQETPDTQTVTWDFGDKSIAWEGRSWHRRGFENSMFGIAFYGEQGTLVIDGSGYHLYDLKEVEVSKQSGSGSEIPHLQNFLECVRSGERPRADIEEGHKSTLLCHLGNIAYRTGHTLHLDAETHLPINDPGASELWKRDYRKGWEPAV